MRKTMKSALIRRMSALVIALAMIFAMVPSAHATSSANKAVQDARNAVVCIRYGILRDGQFAAIKTGSAFLINQNTLLTCNHCVHIIPEDTFTTADGTTISLEEAMAQTYGNKWKKDMVIQIVPSFGTYIPAQEKSGNAELDFSILTVAEPIGGHSTLPLRKEHVETNEVVSALGFPYGNEIFETGSSDKFTMEDVTVTSGRVNNPKTSLNVAGYKNILYFQHDAITTGGNSGGPVLDDNGNVVGVSCLKMDDYSYATDVSEIIPSLIALNIEYDEVGEDEGGAAAETEAAETEAATEAAAPTEAAIVETEAEIDTAALEAAIAAAEGKSADEFTTESYAKMSAALESAKSALTSGDQAAIDKAAQDLQDATGTLETKPAGMNPMILIAIAAAAVIILIILIVLLLSGKKKQSPADDYAPYNPPEPPKPQANDPFVSAPKDPVVYNPTPGRNEDIGATGVLQPGAGETGVLFTGASETTVLSSAPYAEITRKKTGERVTVSAASFVIGRERRKVDYCIEDNSNVSRTHCKLVNNNGEVSVVDLRSGNGTYVNGVKCSPNASITLNTGDSLVLADEEFDVRIL